MGGAGRMTSVVRREGTGRRANVRARWLGVMTSRHDQPRGPERVLGLASSGPALVSHGRDGHVTGRNAAATAGAQDQRDPPSSATRAVSPQAARCRTTLVAGRRWSDARPPTPGQQRVGARRLQAGGRANGRLGRSACAHEGTLPPGGRARPADGFAPASRRRTRRSMQESACDLAGRHYGP